MPDIWAVTSVEDIVDTARVVVGPDEPFGGRSHEDMEADHWAHLTEVLRQQGIVADALGLKRLPHDVVLSERLLTHVGHDQATPSSPDAVGCVAGPAAWPDRSTRLPTAEGTCRTWIHQRTLAAFLRAGR